MKLSKNIGQHNYCSFLPNIFYPLFIITVKVSFITATSIDNRLKPRDGSHPKTPKEVNSIILSNVQDLYPNRDKDERNKNYEIISDISSQQQDNHNGNSFNPQQPSPTTIFYFWFFIITICSIVSILLITTAITFLVRVGRLILTKLDLYHPSHQEEEEAYRNDKAGINRSRQREDPDPEDPNDHYNLHYANHTLPKPRNYDFNPQQNKDKMHSEQRKPYKSRYDYHPGQNAPGESTPGKREHYENRESFKNNSDTFKNHPKSPVSLNSSNLTFTECCQILEVKENGQGGFTRGEINRSFRKKSLVIHPDKHVDLPQILLDEKTQQFRLLCHARDKLLTLAQD